MKLPLKKYLKLLVNYLRPHSHRTLLMGLLLLTSIGLQLANPQVLRYFYWHRADEPGGIDLRALPQRKCSVDCHEPVTH